MKTHHLTPTIYYHTFAPHPPALTVRSGDTVIAETRDAYGLDAAGDPMPESMRHRQPGTTLKQSNPLVGPVCVEGAEQGDLLAVHIREIRLNRDFALSAQSANFGSMTGEYMGHTLLYNPPVPDIKYRWALDLDRQTGTFEMPNSRLKRVEVPLAPFIGSIGTAPRFGRIEMTFTPGDFGGNMDCVETRAGTTLYLPVWADGAPLLFGDVHARQGDGEVNGTALEVTAVVTLELELHKARPAQWPRLEDADHIMVAASTRPLMDCVRLAQMELLAWLVADYGFQREEAWQLMAQVGTMRIGNVVDPAYTVVAKFPKTCLP